jgi:hypothetical protein
MSRDRREEILTRVFDLLKTVPNVATDPYDNLPCVYRNRDELPPNMRPGILLLDADEQANQHERDKNRPGRSPNTVTMKPEIYVCLDPGKPDNANFGPRLNAFRQDIIRILTTDDTLASAVGIGSGGEIFYAGAITDMARGRQLLGEIGIAFWLTYPLIPNEL